MQGYSFTYFRHSASIVQMNAGGLLIDQYRAAISLHNNYHNKIKLASDLFFWSLIFPNIVFCHFVNPNNYDNVWRY